MPTDTEHHRWGLPIPAMFKTALAVIFCLGAMLAPSGDWTWPAPWFISLALVVLMMLPTCFYLMAYNPGLVSERERFLNNPGTASFEKYLVPPIVLSMPLRYIAAGLQHWQAVQQPGWAPAPFLSTPAHQLAAAGLILSCMLQTWSVCANRYFSSVVRLQTNRGHKVCSQGPYAWVRHPGYVAFSLQGIADAVLLQSSWAMGFAVAKALLLVVRTVYEDAFLQKSLPGYAAYAQRVRARWVPLLW